MNTETLLQKLFHLARLQRTSNEVPHAFSRRIMAHLESAWQEDPWAVWNRLLWQAAIPCVGVALLCLAVFPRQVESVVSSELPKMDLEQIVLAPLESPLEVW